jgi:hypothetical protein
MLDHKSLESLKRLKQCGERSTFLELLEHLSDDLIAAAGRDLEARELRSVLADAIKESEAA